MSVIDSIKECVSEDVKEYISENQADIREMRMRICRPIQIVSKEDKLVGAPLTHEAFRRILLKLTDFSLYSRENEMSEGYFTLSDGSRVGVCGKVIWENDKIRRMTHIGSMTIRIARSCRNCAESLEKVVLSNNIVQSTIVFSPPGFGKTTMLRDIARMLSEKGFCVAVVDERHEIAACVQGIPSIDLGDRTDVLDGCPKWIALYQLIRSISPHVVITDEIGDENDARAIEDAARCGVSVIASAHAGSIHQLMERTALTGLLRSGVFRSAVQLGGKPGAIRGIWRYAASEGGVLKWVCE